MATGPARPDSEASAGAQSGKGPLRPVHRQRGQQFDLADVALQQHLSQRSGAAKVAVDLENVLPALARMAVHQIREYTTREQRVKGIVRLHRLCQPRP